MSDTITYECPGCGQHVPEGEPHADAPRVDPDCLIVRNGLNPEHVCHDTGATLREGERCWGATKIDPAAFDVQDCGCVFAVGGDTPIRRCAPCEHQLVSGDRVTYRGLAGWVEFHEGNTVGIAGEHGGYVECDRDDAGLVRR